jgi:hypothetical protein
MIYFLIFFGLIFLSVIIELKSSNTIEFVILGMGGLVLILLAGLRGNIEGDYSSYLDIYNNSKYPYSLSSGIEPGFFFLNKLCSSFNLNFQWIVFSMALASVIPKAYFFKKYSPNFCFSLLAYYSSIYFIFDFIQIRQAVTMSIFMLALPFLYERKFWPYCLALICASFIHISAFILIPGYFVFNRKFNVWLLYSIVGVCGIFSILQIRVPLVEFVLNIIPIPGFSAGKVSYYSASSEFAALSFKQLILALTFIFIRDKIQQKSDMLNVLINLFITGILVATLFNGMAELSFRIKWYFFWTEAVLIVYLVKHFCGDNLKLIYGSYAILTVMYGYMLISLLNELASRGDYIFPYRFFFQ